jgi:CheY-like chemotaxis protein
MDGFMVATDIIKTYGQTDRPLIAALTATADVRTREKVFEVGMDSLLLKPITADKLREELTKLLQLSAESSADGEEAGSEL